jgi:hypothetical protein
MSGVNLGRTELILLLGRRIFEAFVRYHVMGMEIGNLILSSAGKGDAGWRGILNDLQLNTYLS